MSKAAIHRRSRIFPWRCACGRRRYPCEAAIYLRDQLARRVHPGGPRGAAIAGWASTANPNLPWAKTGQWEF